MPFALSLSKGLHNGGEASTSSARTDSRRAGARPEHAGFIHAFKG